MPGAYQSNSDMPPLDLKVRIGSSRTCVEVVQFAGALHESQTVQLERERYFAENEASVRHALLVGITSMHPSMIGSPFSQTPPGVKAIPAIGSCCEPPRSTKSNPPPSPRLLTSSPRCLSQ